MAHDLTLSEFAPRPTLALPMTSVEQPRYPVIDAHHHLGYLLLGAPFAGSWPARPVAALVAERDRSGVRAIVDLAGGSAGAGECVACCALIAWRHASQPSQRWMGYAHLR
jgi:hypothetical protein